MSKVVSLKRHISIEEAWSRILPKCNTKSETHDPQWMAIVYLNMLMQIGILKLFVDGKPVPSNFIYNLRVTTAPTGEIAATNGGKPTIGTRIALEKRLDEYEWSFSEAEVGRVVANFDQIRVRHLVGRYGF